jgi:DNA polymerase bacteriophage-type
VLTVHDELLTEPPDSDEFSSDALAEMMSTNPPWAAGLPLAAAGFEAYRYRKD